MTRGSAVSPKLSVLDLAYIGVDETCSDALDGCVALARSAERLGYQRVWYAEHHNMSSIASSAPAVLIAHVAANTKSIRLGSGGVMLPNHSPLIIAEQFGMLGALHPGRIDLGVGRAPGTDQVTVRALRRDPRSAERFDHDVLELQGFLGDQSVVADVRATPGQGTNVPVYILGSSLYGAELAARFGLPYGFASHFAPEQLQRAVSLYRQNFRPSPQWEHPYVIAGLNAVVAETSDQAEREMLMAKRRRASVFLAGGRPLSDEEADALLGGPGGHYLNLMSRYAAVGTPEMVARYVEQFIEHADCDEVITAHHAPTAVARVRSVELLAKGCGLAE